MYFLWKENKIAKPSEYWNASLGDKLFLRAFCSKYAEEKNEQRKQIVRDKTAVFPVTLV